MPLETASYINQLDATSPLGSDPISAGDEHLRLIKSTLKNTFPNITGVVNVTQDQLNNKVPNAAQTADVQALADSTSLALTTLSDIVATKAAKATSIGASGGLSGGGDLSANRTIIIADTGVSAATYGASNKIPVLGVNSKGQIVSASEATLASPQVLAQGQYAPNTTHGISVSGSNRPIQINLHYTGIQGGATSITVGFQWGLGSLNNENIAINNVGVNYVVYPSPSLTAYVTPSGNTTLYFRVNTANLGAENFYVSIVQL